MKESLLTEIFSNAGFFLVLSAPAIPITLVGTTFFVVAYAVLDHRSAYKIG